MAAITYPPTKAGLISPAIPSAPQKTRIGTLGGPIAKQPIQQIEKDLFILAINTSHRRRGS